ncbi:nuclear transport factor 2 family protein [Patiriisocius hiemis]|uniref:Nuclear transport factor 2 family protein n=1 Tax=Patiriisocius hiemis TaxID=3075604 RepID=A0ABU2YGJ7_9FLAO|nr:nuclear transport factor 2 family protein [Constantimarinum sp. W242]MDT0556360.1 nuclear transport factor 2 family protein [Constantimarinum sp. W242]
MKYLLLLFCLVTVGAFAQETIDKDEVRSACMDYLEGFYEGDTLKIKRSLQPSLNKLGFWKDKETGKYKSQGYMTFQEAVNYSKGVLEKKKFPKEDASKEVEILDISKTTAAAKVTAWWGTDYVLLSKQGDKWMIEQVLWEGPLEKE